MEDALGFSQQLQQIRTVLVRNAPDPRLLDYKAQNSALREELKKQKVSVAVWLHSRNQAGNNTCSNLL